jgi:general secretion pathway protein G
MRTVRKAFTLVEILIVVIILGILAAIVVPQFTSATQDAQGGNILSQLETVNNQLELWRARNNTYPDLVTDQWGAVGTAGTMLGDGYIKPSPSGNGPVNPFTKSFDIVDVGSPVSTAGWTYDVTSGEFGAIHFDEVAGKIDPINP